MTDLGARLHGNDVTLYSCALGRFHAGEDVNIRPRVEAGLDWLQPFLGTALDRMAAVILFGDFAESWCKRIRHAYHRRLAFAFQAQYPALHAQVTRKILAEKWKLASFFAGDCMDFLDNIPEHAGVITFPPVYAGGYERMFKFLHECFEWDEPTYQVFDEGRLKLFLEKVTSRRHWIYGAQEAVDHEALRGKLLGKSQYTYLGTKFWIYASDVPGTRIVTPRLRLEPFLCPRLKLDEPVGDRLQLIPITRPQFTTLRMQYLDPMIEPGRPRISVAVLADGKLIGAFAFSAPDQTMLAPRGLDSPHIQLLCDFSVGSTKDKKLSKLVAWSVLSRESQIHLERIWNRRLRSVVTAAFSNNPVSMKYRGIYRLFRRTEEDPEANNGHRYKLTYGAKIGEKTLDEILAAWKAKG